MSAFVRPSSASRLVSGQLRINRFGLNVASLPWRTMANDGPLLLAAVVLHLVEAPPSASLCWTNVVRVPKLSLRHDRLL